MKTLKTILTLACMAALLTSCNKEKNETPSNISVTLASTDITITNAQPVNVNYTAKDYDGEVTATLGLTAGGVELSNKFYKESGEGVLTFSQKEAAKSASQTYIKFTDGKSSTTIDIHIVTKTDLWDITPADPETGNE